MLSRPSKTDFNQKLSLLRGGPHRSGNCVRPTVIVQNLDPVGGFLPALGRCQAQGMLRTKWPERHLQNNPKGRRQTMRRTCARRPPRNPEALPKPSRKIDNSHSRPCGASEVRVPLLRELSKGG